MEAREKAKELFKTFRVYDFDQSNGFICNKEQTKIQAIKVVDEVLKIFEGLYKPEYCAFDAIGERKFTFEGEYPEQMTGYDMVAYWKQVKDELNKL